MKDLRGMFTDQVSIMLSDNKKPRYQANKKIKFIPGPNKTN